MFLCSILPRRSASSGNVLDNTPGMSQRLMQAADPSLFRVPSEGAVQPEPTSVSSVPSPPPLPAANTGGLAEALRSATLRRTSKVRYYTSFIGHLMIDKMLVLVF